MNVTVLVIDDDVDCMYPLLATWSDGHELPVEWKRATSGERGMEILQSEQVDLVLMDGHLIDERGHEVVAQLRRNGITTKVVMFSSDEKENEAGLRAGADYVVNKKLFLTKDFAQQDRLASIIVLVALEKL